MSETLSKELADKALANNAQRARELLCGGADVDYDLNAAVQNAAAGGHKDVLKLVLVADKEFLHAKQDAYLTLMRTHTNNGIGELLLESINDDATDNVRKGLRKDFVAAVKEQRTQDASQLLDRMVALMFPKSPKVG